MERTLVLIDPFAPLSFLIPVFLYAEIHYRFPFFFSLLSKREPELLADAPFRVDPGAKVPLLILAKDADHFPATLHRVAVTIRQKRTAFTQTLVKKPVVLKKKWWWRILELDVGSMTGWIDIDVEFTLQSSEGTRRYFNDNYRTSSHKPLRVYLAKEPLPHFPGILYADLHSHSSFTDDQVEFGAPIAASRELARAMGLSCFAVTDHSYDLDDRIDDYLTNDPTLPKWRGQQSEISNLNKQHGFVVLRGEEVSCRNKKGKNVHLLVLGNTEFVYGSGDSAEKWFRTRSESAVADAVFRHAESSLCFAAHPTEPIPFLQRVLIGRGSWEEGDLDTPRLHGVQFLNGLWGSSLHSGLQQWKNALLRGLKLTLIAGNDAHGNFNRWRQLGVPFFLIRESPNQVFGKMKTAIRCQGAVTERAILHALRSGSCVVTDGPLAWMEARSFRGAKSSLGGSISSGDLSLDLKLASTHEFGECETLRVWLGVIGEAKERVLFSKENIGGHRFSQQIDLTIRQPSYIRLEFTSSFHNEFDATPHFCLTNPIWINPS